MQSSSELSIYRMLITPSLSREDPETRGYFARGYLDRLVPQNTHWRKELYGEQTIYQIRKEAIIGLVANVSILAFTIFGAIWMVRSSNYKALSDKAALALKGPNTSLIGKAPIDLTYIRLVLPVALYALKTWVMKRFSSIQTKLDDHIAAVRNGILNEMLADDHIVKLRSPEPWWHNRISADSSALGLKGLDASLTKTLYNPNLLRGKREDITIGDASYPDENTPIRKATKLEEFKQKHDRILWDSYAGFMVANAAVPGAEDSNYPQYQNYLEEKGQLESVEKIYNDMLAIRTTNSRQTATARQLKIMDEIETLIEFTEEQNRMPRPGNEPFTRLETARHVKFRIDNFLRLLNPT